MKPWLVAIALLLSSCTTLKRFLVPPPSASEEAPRTGPKSVRLAADWLLEVGALADAPSTTTAVAVQAGRVRAVGTSTELAPLADTLTHRQSLPSMVLVPGFIDASLPLAALAGLTDAVDLRAATTRAQAERLLAEAASVTDRRAWLWAHGVSPKLASEWQMADLDRLVPQRGLWVTRADGQGALMNGALVQQLPADVTPAVVAAAGRLDGAMAEHIGRLLPPPDGQRWMPLLLQTLLEVRKRGVTEVQVPGATQTLRQALVLLEGEARLPVRVALQFDAASPAGQAMVAGRGVASTRLVRAAGVSAWLDPRGGWTDQRLQTLLADADAHGVQVTLELPSEVAVTQAVRVLGAAHRPADALPVRLAHAPEQTWLQLAALKTQSVACIVDPARQPRVGVLARWCPLQTGSQGLSMAEPLAWLRGVSAKGLPSDFLSPRETLLSMLPDGARRSTAALRPGDRADFVLWSRPPTEPGKTAPVVQYVVVDGLPAVINYDALSL